MNQDQLYREVGEAIHLSQVLELNVSGLIEVFNQRNREQWDEPIRMDGDRRTLGQLIAELKKQGPICENTTRDLKLGLESRNFVTHEFFVRNVDAFESEDGCSNAISLVNSHAKRIALACAITEGFLRGMCKTFGINYADILVRQDTSSGRFKQWRLLDLHR